MIDGGCYWLIGASEGLGRALAHALDAAGVRLVLTARNGDRLSSLARELSHPADILPLDVTDAAAVQQAASGLSVDGVIYCAGTYAPVSARNWDTSKVSEMNAVNYLGAVHTLGAVIPAFAKAGAGHVVLIGSLASFRGLPGAVGYSASKAALSSLGESLYADLAPLGVRVQVIHPGFIDTRLTTQNTFAMRQMMTPGDAAHRVLRAMRTRRLHSAFPAPFSWVFTLGRLLPARMFYALIARG